jgi:hypothetical protein
MRSKSSDANTSAMAPSPPAEMPQPESESPVDEESGF